MTRLRSWVAVVGAALAAVIISSAIAAEPRAKWVEIPAKRNIIYGPTTCPSALIGDEVWDLPSGRKLSDLQLPGSEKHRSISPDGKLVAMTLRSEAFESLIGIWSAESGQKVIDLKVGAPGHAAVLLGFAGNKWILADSGDHTGTMLEVWDIETKRLVRRFGAPKFRANRYDISADGMWAFAVTDEDAVMASLGGGSARPLKPPAVKQPVNPQNPDPSQPPEIVPPAAMPPGAMPGRPGIPGRPNIRPGRPVPQPQPIQPQPGQPQPMNEAQMRMAVRMLYAWTEEVAISPDGRQFAVLFNSKDGARLVIWERTGNIVFDESLQLGGFKTENSLQWAFDGTGLLIRERLLMDRKLKRIVWLLPDRPMHSYRTHFRDVDWVLSVPEEGESLLPQIVPTDEIRKSVDAILANAPALVRPGGAISVEIQVGDLQAGAGMGQVKDAILTAITKRLERDGVKVAPGQKGLLNIAYNETSGDRLGVTEKTSRLGAGRDTGQTAQSTSSLMKLELKAQGSDKAIWKHEIQSQSRRSFTNAAITEQLLRESMFEQTLKAIEAMQPPYFVPESGDLKPLPIIGY